MRFSHDTNVVYKVTLEMNQEEIDQLYTLFKTPDLLSVSQMDNKLRESLINAFWRVGKE